jgi:hypothetical protein
MVEGSAETGVRRTLSGHERMFARKLGVEGYSAEPMVNVGPLAYVLAFFAFVGGGYGTGSWCGKLIAGAAGFDRAVWSDYGGIVGGLIGLGLFFGFFLGKVFV